MTIEPQQRTDVSDIAHVAISGKMMICFAAEM